VNPAWLEDTANPNRLRSGAPVLKIASASPPHLATAPPLALVYKHAAILHWLRSSPEPRPRRISTSSPRWQPPQTRKLISLARQPAAAWPSGLLWPHPWRTVCSCQSQTSSTGWGVSAMQLGCIGVRLRAPAAPLGTTEMGAKLASAPWSLVQI